MLITTWLHNLSQWRAQDALVADEEVATNLRRGVFMFPATGLFTGIVALVLWSRLSDPAPELVSRWREWLMWSLIALAVLMCTVGYTLRKLQDGHRPALVRALVWGCIACAMGLCVVMQIVSQWITPNVTIFTLACTLAGLMVYMRPRVSAPIYAAVFALFFFGIGLTQTNPVQLFSNRLVGFVAAGLGWALSVVLWRNFVTICSQQRQLAEVNSALEIKKFDLERLARTDGLTGLINRKAFEELANIELARAHRQGIHTTILLLDLDHFKRVNDTWGHPAGDAVLKNVAALVAKSIRQTDWAGRLGGEEFIILLPNTGVEGGLVVAEKVRTHIEAHPSHFETLEIKATVSIGMACSPPAPRRSFALVYGDADKALYDAKHQGRNRVVVAPTPDATPNA